MKTRSSSMQPMTLIAAVLVATAMAGGVYWWHTSDATPAPMAAPSHATQGAFIGSIDGAQTPAAAQPTELADTQAPDGLRVDTGGHLIIEAANRQVFDYFLDVPASLPEAQRVAMAEAHLRAKLVSPALTEAQSLLQRYLAYRMALAAQGDGRSKPSIDQLQQRPEMLATLRQQLASRTALRQQKLGATVAQAWYGDENAMNAAELERLAVMADTSLTPEQRAAKIAAIDANLPPSVQQARRDASAPVRLANAMDAWIKQGLSDAQIRQHLAVQGVDGVIADRLIQGNREEADWRARYDAYARERDRISAFTGLSDADRATQIAQLRQQTFTAPNEALRAQALDGLAQRK